MYTSRYLEELDCQYQTGRRRGKYNSKHCNVEQLTAIQSLVEHDIPNNDNSTAEVREELLFMVSLSWNSSSLHQTTKQNNVAIGRCELKAVASQLWNV